MPEEALVKPNYMFDMLMAERYQMIIQKDIDDEHKGIKILKEMIEHMNVSVVQKYLFSAKDSGIKSEWSFSSTKDRPLWKFFFHRSEVLKTNLSFYL